jgi:hypothetical protein
MTALHLAVAAAPDVVTDGTVEPPGVAVGHPPGPRPW